MDSKNGKRDLRFWLVVGFAAAPLAMIVLNVVGVFQVNSIDRGLTTINDLNSVKQRYAINFRGSVHDRAISLRDVVLYGEPDDVKKSLREIDELAEFYKTSATALDQLFAGTEVHPEEMTLLKAIKEIESKTLPLAEAVITAKAAGRSEEAWSLLMKQAKPAFIEWLARINKFIDYQENLNRAESAKARETAAGFQRLMIALTALAVLGALILGVVVYRFIVQSLKKVALDLDVSSEKITEVAAGMSDSSRSLAQGAQNQASALESISSSLDEMSAMIQKNAENSKNASVAAAESRERARQGGAVVDQMVTAIQEIHRSNESIEQQMSESNRQMSEIVAVINEIEQKTKVINDIVFQTKLLSFNASVEAARAGASGQGFAVVAEEVGNLAQMSGAAAHQISEMLMASKKKVEDIADEMSEKVAVLLESGRDKVDEGRRVAQECSEVFKNIMGKIDELSGMASEISVSTDEQRAGFRLITGSTGDMDRVTKENSRLAGDTARTLESLKSQAGEMRQAFRQLSELIGMSSDNPEMEAPSATVERRPTSKAA